MMRRLVLLHLLLSVIFAAIYQTWYLSMISQNRDVDG